MCFGSFWFKPKIFFVCCEDTLVKPRAVDPHCFDADLEPDPDPAQNLDADPDPVVCTVPGGVCPAVACASPGCLCSTEACAVPEDGLQQLVVHLECLSTNASAALRCVCLQELLFAPEVSADCIEPVLHLRLSVYKSSVLHLEVSVFKNMCCTCACLSTRALCCTCACVSTRVLCCTWTCLPTRV
jgi:hypothetical protein